MSKTYLKNLTAVFLYLLVINIAYRYFVAPNFGYVGFDDFTLFDNRIYLAFIFVLSLHLFLPQKIERPSSIIIWILYLLVICPTAIISFRSNQPVINLNYYLICIYVGMIVISLQNRFKLIDFRRFEFEENLFNKIIVITWIFITLIFFLQFGVKPFPSIFDVYDTRLESRDLIAEGIPGIGFLIRWSSNVINPLLIALGLYKKLPIFLVIGILGQVQLYTIDATKTTIISPLFIIGIYFLFKIKFSNVVGFVGLISLVNIISMIYDRLTETLTFTQLFIRRIVMIPGLFSVIYFEYFRDKEMFKWSHSFFKGITENPYPYISSPGFLIGNDVFRNVEGNANANIFADGFANWHYFGIIIVSIILSAVLFLLDSAGKNKNIYLCFGILVMPSIALSNTGLSQALLTHGIILSLIVIYVLPSENHERMEVKK